ncbi:MAG: HD domain-containing phosphohydrolase, partial [Pseudomonadales bacterium]
AKALETQLASQRRRELLVNLSGTSDTKRLTEQILKEAKAITNADGGTIFILNDKLEIPQLEFSLMVNDPLDIYLGGADVDEIDLPPLPVNQNQVKGKSGLATYCAITGDVVNISDAYDNNEFDFTHVREFDQQHNYHSKSFLAVPLSNHEDEVIGVLQLVNARDFRTNEVIPFTEKAETIVTALATYAAIALHNRILLQDLKALLDAFIQVIAQAIDAKSSHTSNHCQRVPLLMEMIAQAACEDDQTFANFNLSEDEWYEIRVASWMHDCGKLATPDSVLDKSTKLHLLRDGIHEVHARVAAIRQSLRVDYLEALIEAPEKAEQIKSDYEEKLAELEGDAAFLLTANKGGEFMSEESKERVRNIAKRQWPDAHGELQPLLTREEVNFLCIERGTLSYEERQIINDHMVVTLDMLESLPFPKKLRRVPEYAGGHHEKMDGSGFPRGLTREQMSVPARMMAIADIFEALTSQDRPYKDPMKISLALTILKRMREDNHIDPELFELFVRSRVWEKYAKTTLKPEQLDVTDPEPYLSQKAGAC